MKEFDDSLRLTPQDMQRIQPEKLPKPLSKEELLAVQNEHSWRAVEPSSEQIAAETEAAWREDENEKLQSKLAEAHFKAHAVNQQNKDTIHTIFSDSLTELANMQGFEHWLTEEIEKNPHHLWVGFADIDRFKDINDTFGHLRGDEVLKMVAKLLQSCVRENVDVVVRRSGDEFLLGIQGASKERIQQLGEDILATMNSIGIGTDGRLMPVIGEATNGTRRIELSVGFVQWHAGMNIEDITLRADQAMYEAKNAGKNQFIIADTATS